VKTVIIFPATAKHLEKYHLHDGDVIYETPEDYENITLPYLQSSTFNIQVSLSIPFICWGSNCWHSFSCSTRSYL